MQEQMGPALRDIENTEAQTPWAEDIQRKADTRSEAIFGDKQESLLENQTVTPEGASQLAHIEAAQTQADTEMALGLGITAAQRLSLDEQAARLGWDQEQYKRAESAMAASNPTNHAE